MRGTHLLPVFGLLFILGVGLGLGVIVARSPNTHDNLRTSPTTSYTRTSLDTMREANLQAVLADLGKLPPSHYAVSNATRVGGVPVGPPPRDAMQAAMAPLVTGASQSPPAAVGKELFTQRCTSCHTLGGGRKVGPDLKGITSQKSRDWLIAFITSPDEMIARGDPQAVQLLKAFAVQMPNLGLSPVQAEAILAFIDAEAGAGAPAQAAAGAAQPAAAGKALFEQRCTSCHTLGGGNLVGPDLKGVTTRRPKEWIVSFIMEPDKVIASGDATAAQLLDQFRFPMPNLGISKDQAEQLAAYFESQSGGGGSGR